MILFLLACGSVGLDQEKPGGETTAGVTLTEVSPAWGPPDAETAVTLTGTGFEGAVTAWFGNAEVSVSRVDDQTLVATAPAAGVEATIDVRVRSALGEATLPGAYTYTDDPPDPTDTDADTDADSDADADTDTDTDTAAGQVGGLIQFTLLQVACPSCLGYTDSLFVDATAGFHLPTRQSWIDWLPAEGACVVNPSPTAAASVFLDGGEWTYLTSGSVSVGLRQADGVYSASGLDESDFVRNAGYDLSMPDSGSDLASLDVPDAFTTPQSISDLTPLDILYTTPQTAFAARIRYNAASFTWSPSGGPGSFLLLLDVYTPQGAFQDEIACLGPDNGALTIPSGYLSSYANNSLLVVGMYRYSIGGFDRPDNGSTVETVVSFGVLGTGVLVR